MKKYTKEEIDNILTLHTEWLRDNSKGKRANLYKADLYGADLSRADLSFANLSGADLSGANLYGVNLSRANLSGANLSYANLARANLSGDDLSFANLSFANLSGANLSGADLSFANLYKANLVGANLEGANLYKANLDCIEGKKILTFKAGKHFAYSCDGRIKIGCKERTIEDWLKSYKEIGKENQYSEEEIEAYGGFIKLAKVYFSEEIANEKSH